MAAVLGLHVTPPASCGSRADAACRRGTARDLPTAVLGQNDMSPVTRTAVTVEPFMSIDQVP